MITAAPFRIAYLIADCLLLIVSLNHIPSLMNRAAFPFTVSGSDNVLIIEKSIQTSETATLIAGDTIAAVNGSLVMIPEHLEFISDNASVGSKLTVTVLRNGAPVSASVTTIPFYPNLLYIGVVFFVGISFLLVGCFVFWSMPGDAAGHVFHWMMVLIGTVMMITWGSISEREIFSMLVRSLFFFAYVFGIASFYIFTLVYCSAAPRYLRARITITYAGALLLSSVLTYYHLSAIVRQSLNEYAQFQKYFDFFHIVMFLAFIAGIVNIIRAYRASESVEERNRLEWIFWGFTISSTPFLLLYILPQLLVRQYLVAEEYTTIFFIAVPFSFGISIIQHRLFDIRFLIKRTIVYLIFSISIAVTFFFIVLLFAAVVNNTILSPETFPVVLLTMIIALAVNPLRVRFQKHIDTILFKAHSQYSAILSGVSEKLQNAVSEEQIITIIAESVRSSLPLVHSYWYMESNGRLVRKDFDGGGNDQPILIRDIPDIAASACSSLPGVVRAKDGRPITINDTLFARTQCELFIPVTNAASRFYGAVGIVRTNKNDQLEPEEMSLLFALCDHASEHLQRLELIGSILREKEERKHAEELNTLKSDFVSYVSHELQTPLTSIRMFSELLQKNVHAKQGKEQLQIITGESDRLSRMVNNLLDVSRIESGLKEYRFERCSLNDIIDSVITKMSYMIKKHGFSLKVIRPRKPLMILADRDAIEQAVMNLISNAIKYSFKIKRIRVQILQQKGFAVCSVRDSGEGIPEKNIPLLFNRFYRSPEHRAAVKGAGLGLSLVQHIIDAHHGTIGVESTVGQGTTFTISIPLKN